jgi:NAD(P)-dependent dehydrogenase (short-subunit alcohol dehydrogenase family)
MMAQSQGRKAIFITGAASGIGRATAVYFSQQGWFVGCYDVNSDALAVLKLELGEDNGLYEKLDVTDRSAMRQAVDKFAIATDGALDILYNNAGIDAKGPFMDMEWDTIMAVVNVNLVASLSLINIVLPLLVKTEGSLCMSTSSASATFGAGGLAVYSATKHAVKGLTEALSTELAGQGVRVADVLPGIIDTGMLPDELKSLLPDEGMWRLMPAEAVADAVWSAYHGNDLHYYVPSELKDYDLEATMTPEALRDRRANGALF